MIIKKNSGYVLIFSLLMLSMVVTVATYLFVKARTFVPFMHTMIDRERAKLLAYGGIQVAVAQLAFHEQEKEEKKAADANSQKGAAETLASKIDIKSTILFFKRVVPSINRWQEFELKKDIDGIDAQLKVCLMCEEGKIDINAIYDFEKRSFIVGDGKGAGNWKELLPSLFKKIEEISGGKELLQALEKYLAKRATRLHDISELLTIKEFAVFKDAEFYLPPSAGDQQGAPNKIYLSDIFTTHSGKQKLQTFLLSDSIGAVLGVKRAAYGDIPKRAQIIEQIAKQIEQSGTLDWNTTVKSLYEKELQSLPKGIDSVFEIASLATTFCVLVVAKVGSMTERIYAVLERSATLDNTSKAYPVRIKKVYWI